jgi:transposase
LESEACIWLSPEDRARLGRWVAARNTPQKLVCRARIVLMWAQGASVTSIIRATGKTKRTAYRWRGRYLAGGVAGLERDATRPGRKPPLDAAAIERVVNMTLNEKPSRGTHWSLRKMAKAVGLSIRACSAFGPRMNLSRT